MTILSKKKAGGPGKSEDQNDSGNHHGGNHSLSLASIQNHSQASDSHERLNSPSCWSREEKRSPHYDDYEHDGGPSHGSTKRRHRSSPHRSSRSKLRERNAASPPSFPGGSGVVVTSPKAGPSQSADDHANGYNSGDEYGPCDAQALSETDWLERDRWFEKIIKRKGFIIKKMEEDGACLFRAVADQVYGDQDMHAVVRNHCMDYIAANGDYFSHYVTEDFDRYVNRKRRDYVHGNHIEMQAMSEMYNRTVEVFCYGTEPINIFHGKHKTDNEPIRLSYHRGSHYNSIVDPYKATIGVGLGLPSYTPGLAEKNLMKEAVSVSEDFHIEQTMLEDKLRATDWEATNEAIEEQVARESYLQWLRDNEKRNKSKLPVTEPGSSATVTSSESRSSPRGRFPGHGSPPCSELTRNSPKTTDTHLDTAAASSSENNNACGDHKRTSHYQGFQLLETASFMNHLSPELFGLTEWEDADILAQVLATSQQEYMDNLKKQRAPEEIKDKESVDSNRPSTSR